MKAHNKNPRGRHQQLAICDRRRRLGLTDPPFPPSANMDGRRTAGACTCHLQLRFLVVSLGFSRPWGRISKLGTHIARLIYRRGPSPGDVSRQWVGPHVPPRPPPSLRNGDKSSVVRPARPVLLRAHEKERAAPVVIPVARPPRKKKRLHSRTRVGAIRSRTEAIFL